MLPGSDVGLLTGFERCDLDGAAGDRHLAVGPPHCDREVRAFDDRGQHRCLDGEVLDVLLFDIEGHSAGLFQHRSG